MRGEGNDPSHVSRNITQSMTQLDQVDSLKTPRFCIATSCMMYAGRVPEKMFAMVNSRNLKELEYS